MNWWSWINPESRFEITLFGGGFPVRILIDTLLMSYNRLAKQMPQIALGEWRPGYHVGDFDDDFGLDFDDEDEDFEDDYDLEAALQDIDQLLEWATEFVELVTIYVPPTNETWELAPDEALIPIRLLTEMGMDIEDLLDLLTDMTLLLENPLPISLLISAGMVVSVLLQVTHSLVHNERDAIADILSVFPEGVLTLGPAIGDARCLRREPQRDHDRRASLGRASDWLRLARRGGEHDQRRDDDQGDAARRLRPCAPDGLSRAPRLRFPSLPSLPSLPSFVRSCRLLAVIHGCTRFDSDSEERALYHPRRSRWKEKSTRPGSPSAENSKVCRNLDERSTIARHRERDRWGFWTVQFDARSLHDLRGRSGCTDFLSRGTRRGV